MLWFVVTACANQTKLKLDQNIFANIGEIKCDREPEVGTEVDGWVKKLDLIRILAFGNVS